MLSLKNTAIPTYEIQINENLNIIKDLSLSKDTSLILFKNDENGKTFYSIGVLNHAHKIRLLTNVDITEECVEAEKVFLKRSMFNGLYASKELLKKKKNA